MQTMLLGGFQKVHGLLTLKALHAVQLAIASMLGLTNPELVQDKAFADGGLDPISDDSDDDVPLGHRMTKPMKA